MKTNSILAHCALVLVAGAEIGWPESVIFCQKKRSWKRRMSSRDNGKVHGQWGTPTAHCNLELFRLWSLHYFVVLLSKWWCHKTGRKLGQFWQVYFDKICSTLIYFVEIDLVFHSFCNQTSYHQKGDKYVSCTAIGLASFFLSLLTIFYIFFTKMYIEP